MCVSQHEQTSFLNTQRVPATIVKEVVTIWKSRGRVTMRSVAFRGGLDMTSLSTGSTPRLQGVIYTCIIHVHVMIRGVWRNI